MSVYEEHSKCRGCAAGLWEPAGDGRSWHIVHNEANCLASKLSSANGRADFNETRALEAENRLAVAEKEIGRISEVRDGWYERAMEAEQRLETMAQLAIETIESDNPAPHAAAPAYTGDNHNRLPSFQDIGKCADCGGTAEQHKNPGWVCNMFWSLV